MNKKREKGRDAASRNRREARELAMKILFEADLTPHNALTVLDRYRDDESINAGQREYAIRLIEGIVDNLEQIDAQIGAAAPTFPVDQLPTVDRNVLRIAVFELQPGQDVPVRAAINEAIEIAKDYGGDSSGRFVNGVLGTIVAEKAADG